MKSKATCCASLDVTQNATATIGEWHRIFGVQRLRFAKAGSPLIPPASCLAYLLEAGIAKLSLARRSRSGLAVLLRFPSDLVAIRNSLSGHPMVISATAVTDCRVMELPIACIFERSSNPDVVRFLVEPCGAEAARLISLIIEARTMTAEARFFCLLGQVAAALRAVRMRDGHRCPVAAGRD